MKRYMLLVIVLLSAASFAQNLPKIAVYVTGDVPNNEKDALGTRMLASLVNSGRYVAIERSNSFLAEIEKEHVKQRSGDIDDSQISKLGKQFGVKFVCIAAITPAFGAYQVSARIVNVETAVVAFIGESTSALKTIDDLSIVSDKVVENMFGGKTSGGVRPPAGSGFRDGELDMDMVFVQGGTLKINRRRSVTLNDFHIGKYEVTQKQWIQVMGSGNNPSKFKGGNLPVERVSWNDVQEFIVALNNKTGKKYRLPTDAEWEFAARGGNNSIGSKYSGSDDIDEVAWYSGNSKGKTHPTGAKLPNELGLHDMSGNVSEWTDEKKGSNRVRRGGSWYDLYCGVSERDNNSPNFKDNSLGFRLAHDAQEIGMDMEQPRPGQSGGEPQRQVHESAGKGGGYYGIGYITPWGIPSPWGALHLEGGGIWENGMFWGIDLDYGLWFEDSSSAKGVDSSRTRGIAGIGFNLGGVYDFPVEGLQFAYGGAVGFWGAFYYVDYYNNHRYLSPRLDNRKYRDSFNFLAPFVKLRWKFIELSYRGLLGVYREGIEYYYYDMSDSPQSEKKPKRGGFGWNAHQIMLGLYFETP